MAQEGRSHPHVWLVAIEPTRKPLAPRRDGCRLAGSDAAGRRTGAADVRTMDCGARACRWRLDEDEIWISIRISYVDILANLV